MNIENARRAERDWETVALRRRFSNYVTYELMSRFHARNLLLHIPRNETITGIAIISLDQYRKDLLAAGLIYKEGNIPRGIKTIKELNKGLH